jgi:trehalose synthase
MMSADGDPGSVVPRGGPGKDRAVPSLPPPREVAVPARDPARLRPLIGEQRYADLVAEGARTRAALRGCTVWNVSSTAAGGGVAEMLQVLVGYTLGVGLAVRWLVLAGDLEFFTVTKRIHNRLHGVPGDGGVLSERETAAYASVQAANATAIVAQVRPADVVLLHDPQTAGLVAPLKAAGAVVLWRCHVGTEVTNQWTQEAWGFLRPHLADCDGFVFTRQAYVPSWVPMERVSVIPPSIDPFSPKNQELSEAGRLRILGAMGVLDRAPTGPATFTRRDGSAGSVTRRASVVAAEPFDAGVPLVIQVSRWDRLKDMAGVMAGFAAHVVGHSDAQLALVGPAVDEVSDDPEGREVLDQCTEAWSLLAPRQRRRIRLLSLPMDDVDENAAMVNALQRHATVIVQKSLAEGFGLTVAEGMWKAKAVLASAVGGIVDQVAPGTGLLLGDPSDLDGFGHALVSLLSRRQDVVRLGENARRHVLENFVGDKHLMHYGTLMEQLKATRALNASDG